MSLEYREDLGWARENRTYNNLVMLRRIKYIEHAKMHFLKM